MQKNLRYFILLIDFSLLSFITLSAQTTSDWAGKWDGKMQLPGATLEFSIDLNYDDETWQGNFYLPVQHIKDMSLVDLEIKENTIFFRLPDVPGGATYSGTFEDQKIEGVFTQMGQSFTANLRKHDERLDELLANRIEQIHLLIDSLREGADVPGLGLGLFYKGEMRISEGFGFRNVEKELPVDENTMFAIGSSSKAFTTMGLGLLADDGILDWDEPVLTYMSDFQLYDPFATKEMTAVDLITHRSGLPRHDLLWYLSDLSRADLYSRLRYLEPSASFRSEWQYQNLMYMTAGVLTEKLTNDSWENFVESRIFKPLGMETANFSVTTLAESENASLGYGEKDDELVVLPYHQLDAIGPAGSINASVSDMLKWVELHLGDGTINGQDFINSATLNKMHRPHMTMENTLLRMPGFSHPSYGLGWFIYDYDGLYVIEHGGNIDGFSALVFMIPDEEIGMVILTNKNGTALPYLLAYSITDLLLEREPTDWFGLVYEDDDEEEDNEEDKEEEERKVAGTNYQHNLEDYAGTYEHPGYGEVNISLVDDQLIASYFKYSFPLEHWHYETFFGEEETLGFGLKPTFETDRDGRVVALREQVEQSIGDIRFTKKASDQLSDPDFLETLTGNYLLPGDRVVKISRRGNRLFAFIEGQPEYELVPLQDLEFKLKQLEGFTMEFIKENDEIVALVSHQPNGHIRADRE